MLLKRIRIQNYKGFEDSGWIEFDKGFNVIIGQNNSGKTALLECTGTVVNYIPHFRADKPKNYPMNPQSIIEFDIIETGEELESDLFKYYGRELYIPVPENIHPQNIKSFIDDLLTTKELEFELVRTRKSNDGQLNLRSRRNPALKQIPIMGSNRRGVVKLSEDRQKLEFSTAINAEEDSLILTFRDFYQEKFFVFKAERLNIQKHPTEINPSLASDAKNLPSVLHHLQGVNRHKFMKLINHIKDIFPSVRDITLVPVENNQHEIMIWFVEPETDRPELAISLAQCGTGIGQALAILTVAMTRSASVVAIDEPNSFLHPGASRKLIEILKHNYSQHQYILTTHAPELILAAEPSTLHLVKWQGTKSVVEPLKGKVSGVRRTLSENGIGLSEVFGADCIIWVEGVTEKTCFPMIYNHFHSDLPLGKAFVAVRHTSDFDSDPATAWHIYSQLSEANALMPPTLAFSFDREGRTDTYIDDLKRASKGKMHIIDYRMYENYLMIPEAILAAIKEFVPDCPATLETVTDWLKSHANLPTYKAKDQWQGNLDDPEWLKVVDGANLLKDLFNDLTEAKGPYNKGEHGEWLTAWILKNKSAHLKELSNYINDLVEGKSSLA